MGFVGGEKGQSVSGHIEYLEDVEGRLTIDDVLGSNSFKDAGPKSPSFGFTSSVYWIRFTVESQSNEDTIILALGYPLLDYVDLYQLNNNGGMDKVVGGDMLPFNVRSYDHRTLNFQVEHQPKTTKTYYIRSKSSSSLQFPIEVFTTESFLANNILEGSLLAGYYCVILAMILFNLFIWVSLKDRAYFVYVGYLSTFMFFQLCLNGDGFRFVYPESPALGNPLLLTSFFLCLWFGYRFSRIFLQLEIYSAPVDKLFSGLEKTFLICTILSLIFPYSFMVKICVFSGVLAPPLVIIAGVVSYKKGYEPAKIYILAWLCFVLGCSIYGAKTFAWLPVNLFTDNALRVGSLLEVILLSLALADRIHGFQASSLESQDKLITETTARNEAEKRLNQSLSSRLFLFSDLAHRINNPLNVALGGAQIGRDTGGELVAKVMSFFPEPPLRSSEEAKVVALIEGMGAKIESGFEDANAELCKAVRYVKDLRIIGGVDGADPKTTSLNAVMKECLLRVREDVGERSEKIEIDKCLDDIEVVGHPALLAVGLASWIKHGLLRSEDEESVWVTVNRDVEEGYAELVILPESGQLFKREFEEDIPTKDIVLGLLESQGSLWREDVNEDGETIRLALRLAATEDAWLKAQGAENRK